MIFFMLNVQVTALGAICMPGLLGFVRRFGIMAAQYKAGDFSMAFITVPNIEAGKKLAKYVTTPHCIYV